MRKLILIIALVLSTASSSQSQTWGAWKAGPSEFAEFAATVSEVVGSAIVEMSVLCAAEVPYLTFTLGSEVEEDQIEYVKVSIDGQAFIAEGRYRDAIAMPSWAIVLETDLLEALRKGRLVSVSVGARYQNFRLKDSKNAIDGALEGCGKGYGHHSGWENFFKFFVLDASGAPTYWDWPDGIEQTVSDVPSANSSEPMRFFYSSNGGNCRECDWTAAEGVITEDTPTEFKRFAENGMVGSTLRLSSDGGNLVAALELGRQIRDLQLSTAIDGVCLSACAYAFLGGVSRSLTGSGLSGFAGESLENADFKLLGYHGIVHSDEVLEALPGTTVFGLAELSSGLIVEYLTEMGIDARLLQAAIASNEQDKVDRLDMKFPSNAQLAEYGVFSSQTVEYEPFQLQIVGQGLIATAQRLGTGSTQRGRSTVRLLRVCNAPTPWITYSLGSQSDAAAEVITVMPEAESQTLSIVVDLSARADSSGYQTVMFSRLNQMGQIYREYIEAFGGSLNQFGDLSMPSFLSTEALTIFVPLSLDWRSIISNRSEIDWHFNPRVNNIPALNYTFTGDDLRIAELVNRECLSEHELAIIRF